MKKDGSAGSGRAALKRWSLDGRADGRATLAYGLAATAAWAVVAWAIARVVSGTAAGEDVLMVGVWGAGALAARAFLIWRGEVAADRAGRRMAAAARREILAAAAEKGAAALQGADAGARTSQIIDRTRKLFGHAARWTPGVRNALLSPLLLLGVVFANSWLAGALLAISVLVSPLFIWLTAGSAAAAARAEQSSLDALSGAFQARAAQAGLIRAFRAVGREEAEIARASDALRASTMRILRQAFLSTAVLEFFASVSIALVAVYVGFKLLGVFPFATGETVTLQEGLFALVVAPEFFAPIRRLASLHHDRADAAAAADFLGEWMQSARRVELARAPRLEAAPQIRFENAALARGERAVVGPVSFTAAPGATTVLAGPSGSGKSTCLLTLLGLAIVRTGSVQIDGAPLRPGESLAASVGYVRQAPWIAEGSVRDNLRLAAPTADAAALERALRAADAWDFVQEDRRGLDRPLARFGAGLSGGERQRLALARALLRDAPVLLLDEPTAHLDSEAELRFLRTLHDLRAGRTILVASHRPNVIAAADHVVTLAALAEDRAA